MKSHLLSTGPSSFPCPASRQVTERYSQDGRAARFKRRDLRSGEGWPLPTSLHFTDTAAMWLLSVVHAQGHVGAAGPT